MTRLKLSALLLGATALSMPLGMNAYAQTSQQGQQASTEQTSELGACEKLYRLIDEAAGEDILAQFKNAPQVADKNEADSCALVIKKIGQAGGISKQAVAKGRRTEFQTDTETFRATDTVNQTVQINRKAVVEGKVTVKQPIPEVDVEQGIGRGPGAGAPGPHRRRRGARQHPGPAAGGERPRMPCRARPSSSTSRRPRSSSPCRPRA